MKQTLFSILALASLWLGVANGRADSHASTTAPGLARTTVLIIRHAEKPDDGDGLAPAGVARANAYVNYFENYQIDGSTIKLTALFAAADSGSSHRPYLTLAPLGQATGLAIDTDYKDNDYAKLADALQSASHGRYVLVCWHQGNIPNLIRALGADPHELLPDANWPGNQYGWVIQLRYNKHGQLKAAERIVETF